MAKPRNNIVKLPFIMWNAAQSQCHWKHLVVIALIVAAVKTSTHKSHFNISLQNKLKYVCMLWFFCTLLTPPPCCCGSGCYYYDCRCCCRCYSLSRRLEKVYCCRYAIKLNHKAFSFYNLATDAHLFLDSLLNHLNQMSIKLALHGRTLTLFVQKPRTEQQLWQRSQRKIQFKYVWQSLSLALSLCVYFIQRFTRRNTHTHEHCGMAKYHA